jgi:hypothetical protein
MPMPQNNGPMDESNVHDIRRCAGDGIIAPHCAERRG